MPDMLNMFYKIKIYFLNPHNRRKCNHKSQNSLGSLFVNCRSYLMLQNNDFNYDLNTISRIYRVRPKKRRKPYLRYLWLDLNKRKTEINHFKTTISTI
jgi:hypothetical protein